MRPGQSFWKPGGPYGRFLGWLCNFNFAAAGVFYPNYWDSPPVAQNLKQAFEGFTSQRKFASAGSKIREKIRIDHGGIMPIPGSDFFTQTRSLQKMVKGIIMTEMFPAGGQDQLCVACMERWTKLFLPYDIQADGALDINSIFETLRKLGGSASMKVIKTWLNGWATSTRMHEDKDLGCLLGCCNQSDSLKHYIHCPRLFALQKFLFQDISEEPRIRFGIKDPSISFFKIIGFTFSAYHALKAKYRSGQFRIAPDEMTSTQMRLNWNIFAEVLAAEAGEARVFHRAFSMPKFISFLCTGRHATNSLHDSDQT